MRKVSVAGGPIGKKPRIGKMVGASAGVIEFSKKAVEALLIEGMKGSNNKEQCAERKDYIRRLQLCVKWFLELNGNYMEEQEKLQTMPETASVAGSDCGAIEYYSKEAVEALLNVKMKKGSSFTGNEQWQQRTGYIRRLRRCIKWFLELEERRCDEAELFMKNEEELIAIIMELRKKVAKEESDKLAVTNCLAREKEARVSAEKLQSSLSEEVTKYQGELQASNQKLSSVNEMYKGLREYNTSVQQYNTELQSALVAVNDNLSNHFNTSRAVANCLAREKEARVSAEKLQSSLSEEVTKYQGELQASNQKLSSLNEMYKRLQEYTTSLQQYNTKLESELAASDNLKRVEKEKAAVVENLSTPRGHNKSLQDISGASS